MLSTKVIHATYAAGQTVSTHEHGREQVGGFTEVSKVKAALTETSPHPLALCNPCTTWDQFKKDKTTHFKLLSIYLSQVQRSKKGSGPVTLRPLPDSKYNLGSRQPCCLFKS